MNMRFLYNQDTKLMEAMDMTFGEKLYMLRKEKGLSQETLAEKLNTTRQAISKWENNQGYPETEKLLMLSNIFEVTVDSLLKESNNQSSNDEKGYYVSKECAEGFLAYQRKATSRIALGVAILILAGVPYFLLGEDTILSITFSSILVIVGIGLFISAGFMDNSYRRLKQERLLFDPVYFTELQKRYALQKKKYIGLIIFGLSLIFACGIIDMASTELSYSIPTNELFSILFAFSSYCLIYSIGMSDANEVLLKNEERMNKLYMRLWKAIKRKLGD